MGETILVADDSAEIRKFLEETILKPSGYNVVSVGDGMSALTLATVASAQTSTAPATRSGTIA